MIAVAVSVLLALHAWALQDRLAETRALFQKGDFESAARMYRGIVQQEPKNEEAQAGLLRSLLRNDDLEDAQAKAQDAEKVCPSSSSVLSAVGDILFRGGNLPKAYEKYLRAIEANPHNGRAYLGMAKLHSSDFNRRSMRLMDRKAYENDPSDPEIILAYATDLPAAEQIPLLEKYLELGLNEPESRRDSARYRMAYLKAMGDRRTWVLNGEPSPAVIELQPIMPSPNRRTGYKARVCINGQKPVDLQFDTGASGLMIHRKLAERLGIRIISESAVRGIGEEGEREASVGLAASVRVGNVEFHDCTVEISQKKLVQNTQGLIGSSLFQQFLIGLDLPKHRLRLRPLPAIQGRRYDDPESWKELDRLSIPELGEFTSVRRWHHLLLDTVVNGKSRGYFYLDTGAASNFISMDLARQVTSLQPANGRVRGISGEVKDVSVARSVLLQVGRFRQQNEGILAISFKRLSKDIGLEISGLLGHPLLSQLVIVIDYRDGLLNLICPGEKDR